MKITKQYLKEVIKEEIEKIAELAPPPPPSKKLDGKALSSRLKAMGTQMKILNQNYAKRFPGNKWDDEVARFKRFGFNLETIFQIPTYFEQYSQLVADPKQNSNVKENLQQLLNSLKAYDEGKKMPRIDSITSFLSNQGTQLNTIISSL
jgi:hypothetical protein